MWSVPAYTHVRSAVPLVCGSLRLAPINSATVHNQYKFKHFVASNNMSYLTAVMRNNDRTDHD